MRLSWVIIREIADTLLESLFLCDEIGCACGGFAVGWVHALERNDRQILPANENERFVDQYFAASRLHHIGTARSEMQKLVSDR